jgi:hypothetical protein
MPPLNPNPRVVQRQRERERMSASPFLAQRFPHLKGLTVELRHYAAGGIHRTSQLKYSVNLAAVSSVFSFECPNEQCIDGGFDISHAVSEAVAGHQGNKTGQASCQGWKSKTTVGTLNCGNELHYSLTLEF